MAIIAVDRIGALRMDAVLPDRCEFLLPRLHQRRDRRCRLNSIGWNYRCSRAGDITLTGCEEKRNNTNFQRCFHVVY